MSHLLYKSYVEIKGQKYPKSYSLRNVEFALNYKPLESDIILVTYPKSGTTWTQQILYLILNGGNPLIDNKNFVNNTCLEYKGSDCMRTPVIKTHLSYNLLPNNKSTKYLYVIRNPKDTTLSYYNHMKILFNNFNEFFDHFICGQIPYGDYFEHLNSFWSHRMDNNFCFLIYEQMKSNAREAVLKIAQFLGDKYVKQLTENNDLILNKVLEYSSIEFMKTNIKENQFIVNKGVVGQWRQHFNEQQNQLIDNRFDSYFKDTELQSIWRQCMQW